MDTLSELIDKYGEELDKSLMRNPEYNRLMGELNSCCETKLSAEQAKEISETVGRLSSVIFKASAEAGVKLGAKLVIGLLSDDS